MIIYEITAVVEPDLIPKYERYMRERHIPDLLATGYFTGASFARSEQGRYRVRYEPATRQDLDRYLNGHAPPPAGRLCVTLLDRGPVDARDLGDRESVSWMPLG